MSTTELSDDYDVAMTRIGAAIVLITFVFFCWLMSLNFHSVDDHQVYRSAQLSAWELRQVIKFYGIKTIINLRGDEPDQNWYHKEMAVAAENGVKFVSIDMSSRTIPDRSAELRLLDAFHNAPKPILIHCFSGADRTGEAAAIYQMVFMNKTTNQALEMLTPRYLHLDYFRPAKRYFVRLFKGEKWLQSQYYPCTGKYQYYDKNNPDCRLASENP